MPAQFAEQLKLMADDSHTVAELIQTTIDRGEDWRRNGWFEFVFKRLQRTLNAVDFDKVKSISLTDLLRTVRDHVSEIIQAMGTGVDATKDYVEQFNRVASRTEDYLKITYGEPAGKMDASEPPIALTDFLDKCGPKRRHLLRYLYDDDRLPTRKVADAVQQVYTENTPGNQIKLMDLKKEANKQLAQSGLPYEISTKGETIALRRTHEETMGKK